MDKKEFLDVTREYFKRIGFQNLKKSKFYYESNELVLQVYLNHSNFSETYYIDYYIRIKSFHLDIKDVTNDKVWDTHFSRLTDGKDNAFVVEYENWDRNLYLQKVNKLVENQLIPIMTEGVKFLKKYLKNENKFQLYIVFTEEAEKRIKHFS